jgi:hypothetical protein
MMLHLLASINDAPSAGNQQIPNLWWTNGPASRYVYTTDTVINIVDMA